MMPRKDKLFDIVEGRITLDFVAKGGRRGLRRYFGRVVPAEEMKQIVIEGIKENCSLYRNRISGGLVCALVITNIQVEEVE